MFFRVKVSGQRRYLQIVENKWVEGRTKQTVLATVGRLDELAVNGIPPVSLSITHKSQADGDAERDVGEAR